MAKKYFGTDGIKVGLMTINSVDGEQTVQGCKDSSGGDLLVDEQTWERDSTTYGPQILSFIDSGVTDVYVGTGDTQFAQFLLEADQLGLEARFWGSTGTISANTIELAGELSEGAYGVNVISSATGDKPGLNAYRDAMYAAGAEEAQIIKEIVTLFRYHAMPEFPLGGKLGGRTMLVPSTFDISYVPGRHLHKIDECALESVQVKYGGERTQFFVDDQPVETELTLQFRELGIITKEKIAEGF